MGFEPTTLCSLEARALYVCTYGTYGNIWKNPAFIRQGRLNSLANNNQDLLELLAEFMFEDGVGHVLEGSRPVEEKSAVRVTSWVVPAGGRGRGGGGRKRRGRKRREEREGEEREEREGEEREEREGERRERREEK